MQPKLGPFLAALSTAITVVVVGTWSAQLGGRAIYRVPLAFLGAMAFGSALGMAQYRLLGAELGIALSVLLLGGAIALERRAALWLAALGVGIFGVCHGYAHGSEMPAAERPLVYAAGFLLTTVGLHLVGALGGLLLIESRRGRRWLTLAGAAVAIIGGYLLVA